MRNAVRIILLIFFSCLLLFSSWQLWAMYRKYREGTDRYGSLEQYVSFPAPEDITINSSPAVTSPAEDAAAVAEEPDVSTWPQVDFDKLSEINSDIVGWLYIEGTNINYPIVQGTNNDYYLNHLFDGTHNGSGSIFLDYRCSPDFSDLHSIIYGHHMKNQSMFGSLMDYKKQEFYDEHSVALLVTPAAYHKIQIFSGYVSDTWSDAWKLSFSEYEYLSWLNEIQRRSCFESSHAPATADRIITLSTCTYEFDTAKFVLHGFISETLLK